MTTESSIKKISFIGSGNLAINLALAFEKVGHQIVEVYSRNLVHANELADKLANCKPTDSLDFSNSAAKFFIIAVKDEAISEIANNLIFQNNSLVLHTSGTTSLDALDLIKNHAQIGIFYPLQTFKKDTLIDVSEVPILIESKNEGSKIDIEKLAKSISKKVQFVNSEDRKTIHLAAVFASNFTNRMLQASEEILAAKNIPLDILKPLVQQSIENCFAMTPDSALTGPAKRGDINTINQHKKMLEEDPKLKELYRLISNQILNL